MRKNIACVCRLFINLILLVRVKNCLLQLPSIWKLAHLFDMHACKERIKCQAFLSLFTTLLCSYKWILFIGFVYMYNKMHRVRTGQKISSNSWANWKASASNSKKIALLKYPRIYIRNYSMKNYARVFALFTYVDFFSLFDLISKRIPILWA